MNRPDIKTGKDPKTVKPHSSNGGSEDGKLESRVAALEIQMRYLATREEVREIVNECLAPLKEHLKEHYATKTWILVGFVLTIAFVIGTGITVAGILANQ